MVRLKVFSTVWGVARLSVTRMVKLNEPSAVGVPLSVPPDERLSPPGKGPEATDHVYGVVPPVAAKACEYAVPTEPAGRVDPVEMARGGTGELIVNANALSTVCRTAPLSLTLMVKLNEPAAVGVPLNMPPAVRVSPAGREPDSRDHVYGVVPPVAVNVCV